MHGKHNSAQTVYVDNAYNVMVIARHMCGGFSVCLVISR
jgi:hypothetical protein